MAERVYSFGIPSDKNMSWLCRQCETVNIDDVIECEVCDAVSPYLSRFDYDEITPLNLPP